MAFSTAVIASLPLTAISTSPRGDRNEFNILLDVNSSSMTNIFMNLFSTFLIVVYFEVCFITGRALGYVLVS